jgi:hypothetical protein
MGHVFAQCMVLSSLILGSQRRSKGRYTCERSEEERKAKAKKEGLSNQFNPCEKKKREVGTFPLSHQSGFQIDSFS